MAPAPTTPASDWRAAEKALCEALASSPLDATLLIQYGQCLLRLGRRDNALAIAARAEATKIDSPQLRDALGSLLTHLEEADRALPHFQLAVRAAPQNVDFLYNLSMAERMTGDLDAAESNLDRVVAARPHDGEAHYARSGLRTQTADRNHVSQLKTVLQELSGRRAALPVAFALAKELEDLGENARSFSYLQTACRSYRSSLRYDVADDVAVLDQLRDLHSGPALKRLRAEFDNDECIFIVGLPRSGTTLVERILGSHSDVFPAGELDAFQRVAIEAVARNGVQGVRKLDFVGRSLEIDFSSLGQQYLDATRPRTGHTAKFTDKLPLNYLYAGLIHAALPRARFIAVQRNPMDVCYAMYKTLFRAAYPFTYDLEDLGRYYVAWERLMRHWQAAIGDAWLTMNYEELVSAPELVTRKLMAHCGLSWDERCLDFHARTSAVSTASAAQVRRPVHGQSVGKWLGFARELEPLSRHLEAHGVRIR